MSFYLNKPADIENAIALFKQSYELALAQRARFNRDKEMARRNAAPATNTMKFR